MTIKGEIIEFITAKVTFDYVRDIIVKTVDLVLLVDGKELRINQAIENIDDLQAKVTNFKAGVKITEVTL